MRIKLHGSSRVTSMSIVSCCDGCLQGWVEHIPFPCYFGLNIFKTTWIGGISAYIDAGEYPVRSMGKSDAILGIFSKQFNESSSCIVSIYMKLLGGEVASRGLFI